MMEEELNPGNPGSSFKTILLTGLLAGTLDILSAFANAYLSSGAVPTRVLQYIASGVLGKEAFEGGWPVAALGLFFHYFIAFSWTILFFFLYPQIKILGKNPLLTGIIYGLVIWLVMNLIVVPLTNVTRAAPLSLNFQAFLNIVILMILVGLPISILVNKHYSNNS